MLLCFDWLFDGWEGCLIDCIVLVEWFGRFGVGCVVVVVIDVFF